MVKVMVSSRPVKSKVGDDPGTLGKVGLYDLDRRSYKNVNFSGFSIYEVKSGGLSLKKN